MVIPMNQVGKNLVSGLIIWIIPFLTSFFFWDVEAGGPSVSQSWFNAIMAFTFAIGFAIALVRFFSSRKKLSKNEGFWTGLLWYLELIVLDLIFLVGIFKMSLTAYAPMFLLYLQVVVITSVLAHYKK